MLDQAVLINPAPPDSRKGNTVTTDRWAGFLEKLGVDLRVTHSYDGGDDQGMIALHARRSADSIQRFAKKHPERPLVVALTGTDLYRDLKNSREAQQSVELADRLVLLQSEGLEKLDVNARRKAHIIHQSVSTRPNPRRPEGAENELVCLIVAHLRAVKDPLRLAYALREVPESSRLHGYHLGGTLDENVREEAENEAETNPRFTLLGEQSRERTLEHLKGAD
jgi:hypothetical protein